MGRPLNKKYFGNRNPGGIGSESVVSYGTYVAGSGWTATPTASISPPTVPGGATATGTFLYSAKSAAVAVGGTTAYPTGTVVSVAGGASFTVATLAATTTLNTVTIGTTANLTFSTTTLPVAVGTSILVGGVDSVPCGLLPSTYYVSASPAPTATSFTLTSTFANAIAGTNNLGATTAGATTGLIFTTRDGTNPAGTVATVTLSTAGSYSTFTATPVATTNTVSATGLTLDLTYGLLSVTVVGGGSGYVNAADAALVFSPAATPTNASATAVLTNASENSIVIRAKTTSGGTVQVGDIIKQSNTRSYKVETADGIKVCKLVADDTPAFREAYIIATAANGSTYYVTKLTAHRATLVYKAGTNLPELDGNAVPWTFDSTANGRVIIENA
jgi:hypothetical protein